MQVHLGGGIWVEEEKWHQLQRTQGDSKFTKNLAVMIWGTETLKNRSVTGVATKKKKDALPKPPLSPSKLKIVRGKHTVFKRFVIKIRLCCISSSADRSLGNCYCRTNFSFQNNFSIIETTDMALKTSFKEVKLKY